MEREDKVEQVHGQREATAPAAMMAKPLVLLKALLPWTLILYFFIFTYKGFVELSYLVKRGLVLCQTSFTFSLSLSDCAFRVLSSSWSLVASSQDSRKADFMSSSLYALSSWPLFHLALSVHPRAPRPEMGRLLLIAVGVHNYSLQHLAQALVRAEACPSLSTFPQSSAKRHQLNPR